jgi:hypothetical protein
VAASSGKDTPTMYEQEYGLPEFLADINYLVSLGLVQVMVDDDIGVILTERGLELVEGIEAA